MKKQYLIYLLLIFCLSVFISGCKTKKLLTMKDAKTISTLSLLDSCKQNEFRFETINSKFKGEFNDGTKKIGFSGHLRIIRDSAIWISMNPGIGIEFVRAILTKDSVKFINRMTSEFFAGTYEFFNRKFGLKTNFNILQSVFVNRLFSYPYSNDLNKAFNDYIATVDSINYTLKPVGLVTSNADATAGKANYSIINVNSNSFRPDFIRIFEVNPSRQFYVKYPNPVEKGQFPEKIELSAKSNVKELFVGLRFIRIIKDKNIRLPFRIPTTYKEIKI